MSNQTMSRPLYEVDPEVAMAIDNEVQRQHAGLELIASENFVGEAVLEAFSELRGLDPETVRRQRREKFLAIGRDLD